MSSYDRDLARARARAGAAYLENTEPDWRERINRDILDLSSCQNCILGQIYGDYGAALGMLDITWVEGVAFGFVRSGELDYQLLTESWLEILNEN